MPDDKQINATQVESAEIEAAQAGFGDYFADQSTTSAGNWLKHRARQRQLAAIQRFVPDTTSAILEIGPGLGELTALFVAAGYSDYTVVEPNTAMREYIATMGVQTRDYFIPKMPEDDESFDVIVLFNVFEHLNGTPEAQIFMSEARRILRPDGLLCIMAPDYLHWQRDFFNGDYTHSHITTVRRSIQLFHDNGFSVEQYTYFSGFASGLSATFLSYLARCGLFLSVGNNLDSKLYKLKTTLLRSFLLIGIKA